MSQDDAIPFPTPQPELPAPDEFDGVPDSPMVFTALMAGYDASVGMLRSRRAQILAEVASIEAQIASIDAEAGIMRAKHYRLVSQAKPQE